MGNYHAILYVQAAVDLASCVLVAAFVHRVSGERQAWIALYLGVLCPFTANYTSNVLTETLSIFCVALALYSLALVLQSLGSAAAGFAHLRLQLCRIAASGWSAPGCRLLPGDRNLWLLDTVLPATTTFPGRPFAGTRGTRFSAA